MASEPRPPELSVLTQDGLLVAHLWRTPGEIRKAGRPRGVPCAYASAEVFAQLELVVKLAEKARDFDGFVFELELEDLRVHDGHVRPDASRRRF